jgi:hypothetical protein
MNDDIDYIHQGNDVVYIFSIGAGSGSKEFSEYEFERNNIFEMIDYKSGENFLGIPIRDFLDVKDDIKKIRAEIPITEKYRLKKLFELLEFYLLNTSLNIVLIGFSHGCVIIHAAILKLKMRTDIQTSSYIDRITIMAVNSPNLIPPEIIHKQATNKVFNIYNIKDFMLSLGKFFKITKNDYLPDLSYSHIKTLKFSEGIWKANHSDVIFEYSFVEEKRIIYINIENTFKYLKISNLILKQKLRHSGILNLIVLFKTLFYGTIKYYLPVFLLNYDHKLSKNTLLHSYFIEFDRYLYLYLQNKVPKDTQIGIIRNTNYNNLLELLDIKDLSHLYPLISPRMSYTVFLDYLDVMFSNDFIINNLHLLTLNELQLLLLTGEERKNISMIDRYDFLKKLRNKKEIIKFKSNIRTIPKDYKYQTYNLLSSLYYINMLFNYKRSQYDKLDFMKRTTKEKFYECLDKLDDEILFSIYIKVKNNQVGEIFQRQNSA